MKDMLKTQTIHPYMLNSPDPSGNPGPWTLYSVVVSPEEFDLIVNEVENLSVRDIRGAHAPGAFDAIRQAKHIPMMARGTKTSGIFEALGVEGKYMSIIVRGEGPRVYAAAIQSKMN